LYTWIRQVTKALFQTGKGLFVHRYTFLDSDYARLSILMR
jgi:hypothetical protein